VNSAIRLIRLIAVRNVVSSVRQIIDCADNVPSSPGAAFGGDLSSGILAASVMR